MKGGCLLVLLSVLILLDLHAIQSQVSKKQKEDNNLPTCNSWQLIQSDGEHLYCVNASSIIGVTAPYADLLLTALALEEELSVLRQRLATVENSVKQIGESKVPELCQVGEWGFWSPCSKTCGFGVQSRERTISSDSSRCPAASESRSCKLVSCIDCNRGCTTYVKWGDHHCPHGRERLMSGIVSGSGDQNSGGGYNSICLDLNTNFRGEHSDKDQNGGRLYAAEYETSGGGVYELRRSHNTPIPCTICKVQSTAVIVVPGTMKCSSLWVREYWGYLMSNADSHKKGEYVCVHHKSTPSVLGGRNQNQLRWYPVEGRCGNLPCPPFVQDRELTCVVCSLPENITGTSYLRWGRHDCPNEASMVYEGLAVGSAIATTGAGANPLCIVDKPIYGWHSDVQNTGSSVVGAIYGTSGYGIRGLYPLHGKQIPCVVCLVTNRSVSFNYPGRIDCPPNFALAYNGYMFAAHYSHQKTNWICIDRDAKGLSQTSQFKEAVWYPTEIHCSGMTCDSNEGEGGYIPDRELACAVCITDSNRISSIFTDWGRKSCSGSAFTIYSGFVAGSSRDSTGNGANLNCMPRQANYIDHWDKDQDGARLSGFEFEYGSLTNYEVPCAVCETGQPATFTQVGRSICPSGFTVQYLGYLFSNVYNANKGEFICINDDQEYYGSRGNTNDNAGGLYRVETQCGSLPCPPFTEDREVVCAVCSVDEIAKACPHYQYGKFCVLECPQQSYIGKGRVCHRCHDQCLEGCYGLGNQECVGKCKAFTYRDPSWKSGSVCLESCPNSTYPSDDKNCIPDTEPLNCGKNQSCWDICGVCGGDNSTCRPKAIYYRWGSNSCRLGSRILYVGFASSSHGSQTGSGYNLLCIPVSPNVTDTFRYMHNDVSQNGGLLYGVQYQTGSSGVSVLQRLAGYTVACAACESSSNGIFTISGSNLCPHGWVQEYDGFLMSSHYSNNYRNEFVCVDRYAGQLYSWSGSHLDLYTTEYGCGNLPCPRPFVGNREVTCAVCSALNRSGTVYTRWGQDDCGGSKEVETVYHGIAAGSHSGHKGGGANAVCLTENVTYTYYSDSSQPGAYLYGMQYQSYLGLREHNVVHEHLAACSVCFVPEKQSHVMIPGTTFCPLQWKPLYSGYLYAGHHSHHKANWECIDKRPVSLAFPRSDQARWYPTQIYCGSIVCSNTPGSYVGYREVACTVCQPDTKRRSVVYTRWGRNDCPGNSRKVYSGFTAGSYYSQSGNGANILCMNESITYGDHLDGNQEGSRLYGVEYLTSGYGLRGHFQNLNNHEVPCVVCEQMTAEAGFTQFGSVKCPLNYITDYTGYTFSPFYASSYTRGEYICVDKDARGYNNGRGASDNDQGMISPVEIECQSQPCPPYMPDREVICVHCSLPRLCCPLRWEDECVSECPRNSFVDGRSCTACHEQCNPLYGCVGPASVDCIVCANFKLNESCVAECPVGFVSDVNKTCLLEIECVEGYDDCGVCGGNGSTCNVNMVYVRWGRTVCTNSSRLLYNGTSASSANEQSGSGHNRLCLQNNPSFAFGHNDADYSGALIFGAAYNTSYSGISKFKNLHGHVVPCAVCESHLSGVLTVPAATECPSGFVVEYRGYIMANHYYRQYRGEHVCVDVDAEAGQSSVSKGEAQFHFTEFQCGALPCDKYPSNREVPCIVCSRESTGGATYTRWGKSGCPQPSQVVYFGHAASGASSEQGGGANPLCLHGSPSYGLQYSDSDQDGARVYGVKYGTSGFGLAGPFPSVSSYTIPCVVCFTPLVYSIIEVAGRRDCPKDWKLEYSGYLFAAYFSHFKTNWVCVDGEPERLTTHSGTVGWWYPTEIECGSIACDNTEGRYGQDKEISCAVCSADTERYSVIYTRWGHPDCPSGSRIAYSGQAVGAHYNSQTGSGANVLCLHSVALFGLFNPSNQNGARVYGYEYEPWGLLDGTLRGVGNYEVPCAVCENVKARSTFTVFGNDGCPATYHKDYSGFVFSHYYGPSSQHKGEFVCVDQQALSYGQRSNSGDNEALMYAVEVESCSLISCPPYSANRELDCAQCSRPLIGSKLARDCIVSQWSDWSACSKPCNIGQKLRTRVIVGTPINGGRLCPILNETTICNVRACANATIANSTYIHWGRTDCPGSSRVLHTGTGASSHYNHQGGGYNYICLPSEPKKYNDDPYHSDLGQGGGYLQGVEYEFSYLRNFSSFSSRSLMCARCALQRGPVLAMFGTTKCPTHFSAEYTGYVMANYFHASSSYYKSEYICVDSNPSTAGSRSGSNQGRIYPSEYECGGLPCPPFVSHREAACAVCSSISKAGSSYVQWGKKSCTSANASLVYSGIAVGSLSSKSGSGANSICVISGNNQTYLDFSDSQQSAAQLHAVKLVTSGYGIQTMQGVHNRILSCSLCFLDEQYSVVTIPAMTECPSGWQQEYRGYLFSAYHSHQKNDWRCIDKSPDNIGSYSSNQADLYPVEIECGSIVCGSNSPSYVQNREVSCIVCSTPKSKKSATYTRWGRNSCPTGSKLVYSGFAAGAISTQTGSGTSLLCMPQQPQYDDYNGLNQDGGRLYGFEYETSGYGLTSPSYKSVHNFEVPCAVCDLQRDAAVFAHYGEHDCPRGYATEYIGYVFSTHYSHKSKGEYICIDKEPEGYNNGRTSADDNQGRLFPVEVICGTLPCPPYTNQREVKCATCSWVGRADKRPQDCKIGEWSSWSSCSVTCGHGKSNRVREIVVKPQYGGTLCDETMEQTRDCHVGECPGPAFSSPTEDHKYESVVTYVRWGLQSCPSHAKTILTGNAAGAKQGSTGSGYNRICLASSPDIGTAHYDKDHNGGLLVGAEYEPSSYGLRTLSTLNNQPIGCSLCEAPGSSVLMVPGTDVCPTHWYMEYSGYLMANHHSHNRGEYVCVDGAAKPGNGSSGVDHDGWYPVEAECGTLPCPPFFQDRELTCVVCSLPRNRFGSVYVRWGRNQCPGHAEIIYSGLVAGPASSSTGSGANPLCLVMNPIFRDHNDKDHNGGRIYGVQYGTSGYGLPTLTPLSGKAIPCTLCYLNHKSPPIMVPASHVCPRRWSAEYFGYLFAAHYTNKKTNWICIDKQAESFSSSTSSQSVLYPTEIQCGSISCSRSPVGYVQDKEVACVVCRPDNDRATAVYTQWGRNRCSSSAPNTKKVYSGFAAGAHYNHDGSGADTLCLPSETMFGENKGTNEDGALLYGYEYYTSGYGLSSSSYIRVHLTEVPCSVCENVNGFTSLTLFGKSKCPSGYDLDYSGYMFSNGDSDKKGQFLCVDSDTESYSNSRGSSQDNNARLFPVEAQCGSIPCPPYTDNREILCVQCTKQFKYQCDYYVDEEACVRECSPGKYADLVHICRHCQEECAGGCTGPLASDCIECRHVRWNQSCLAECPPGTVSNSSGDCVIQEDIVDCAGVTRGHAVRDKCGVCNGDESSCGQQGVYVRWGKRYCPISAKLLYTGYMAGSHSGNKGSGFNKLCLPLNPSNSTDWRQSDADNGGSRLFGVQYQTNYAVQDLQDVNGGVVACAVCEAKKGPVIMIAGTYVCPINWTVQYEGYVMSSSYSHYKGEYVCVDREPEYMSELSASSQAYLYATEGKCGSLRCPPYVDDREITCAVCSRPRKLRAGTVYTRWGSKRCPAGCDSLYSGQAAGSHNSHTGSGSNPLCLTLDPVYADHNDGDQSSAKIYGIRFLVSGSVVPAYSSVYSYVVPCTVCYRPKRQSNVMVVGQDRCPTAWSLEYSGYLLSTYYSHQKSNWICSDAKPDSLSYYSSSQADWYSTEVECGSLYCKTERKGYIQNREVTCSVCSPSNDRQSSVYVRWGRSTCPETATKVYDGMMAGANDGETGSGANYLCLHTESSNAQYHDQNQDGARLYGYEYDSGGLGGRYVYLSQKEVACVVCENQAASTTFTVFGNLSCPYGYRRDFSGFAFSNYHSRQKGEYVCVDMEAESFENSRGSNNDDQGRLVPTEFYCGTLPCPPWVANREVPCVQCSKVVGHCFFFILGMDCVHSCPEGFYNDSKRICQKCHKQCVGCIGPNATDCIACRHYKTGEGRCVSSCPSDYSPNHNGDCVFDRDNKVDCAGIMNGTKTVDQCGLCGGNGSTCNLKAVYVRWGKTTCPETARVLFAGYAAGSYDSHTGGGYNSLCVHRDPNTDWIQNDGNQNQAYLYGFAYGTSGYGVQELLGVHGYGVPCAVCEARRGDVFMIPGTTTCPNSYVNEYNGYLVTVRNSNRYRGEYVCLDRSSERGSQGSSGSLWVPAEFKCGSLKCPPYTAHREVTCVVCSPPTKTSGTIFVRWGRRTCTSTSTEVYSGRSVGPHYNVKGSGANPLCLVLQPQYLHHNDGDQSSAALYGAQYVTSGHGVRSLQDVHLYAVPCAVCFLQDRSAVIVSPGQPHCPADYYLQYWGYLFAAHSGHHKSNWVCIDHQPETLNYYSSSQALWYPTEVYCGGMRCGTLRDSGYVQYHEVTCAVCSPPNTRRSSVYVRYGRNDCPPASRLVYAGFLAGSRSSETGSGASLLCMRSSAVHRDHHGVNQGGAYLNGYEYETSGFGLNSNAFRSVHNREIPCAVCENVHAETTFVQHGSNACPEGYMTDYSGFLFANRYHTSSSLGTNYRSEYVCIDFTPQYYHNGRGNSNDNYGQLYPVEIKCSGIPCPPYRNHREVTCAQCSKNITFCPGYTVNGTCFASCPPGTYGNAKKTCQPCHPLCNQSEGCTGPEKTHCDRCAFVTVVYYGQNRCDTSCPQGFLRTVNNTCIFSTLVGVDCEGVQHGGKKWDACGVCGGTGETCDQTAVYTRWGRSSCPSQSRQLFSGFASSSNDGHTGSGFTRLCLASLAGFAYEHYDTDQNGALIYGAEYETASSGVSSFHSLHNLPIPCSVCEARRGPAIMIPGTTLCPNGWSLEYYGFLMSNYFSYEKGEYVCVDFNSEGGTGSSGTNSDRWYTVEMTDCGNVLCPPYVNNREITCVVCIPPPKSTGDVYTRWSRSVCPTGAHELYKGQAVSSHHSHNGGGINPLCITLTPSWSNVSGYNDGSQHGGKLYSAIIYPGSGLPSLQYASGRAVPCVACYVTDRQVFMSAGQTDCPSGWSLEYAGYLFAAYYNHRKSDWTCVDKDPETYLSGSGSSYWYPTEIRCGTVGCSNRPEGYVANREVTCAVCSSQDMTKGSVYTHWGRGDCPTGNSLVYSGFVGGAYHSHKGSGGSLLCMRSGATYMDRNDNGQSSALLYGVQYASSGYLRGSPSYYHGYQIPCAVCENRRAVVTFTQFGSLDCPQGYLEEYTGYVFASYFKSSNYKTSHICVDRLSSHLRSGSSHGIVYPVETECGSLPCPPYVQNRELVCIQCSRVRSNCPFFTMNDSVCVVTCPVYTYTEESNRTCHLCDTQCDISAGCRGPGNLECKKCKNKVHKGACVESCPVGTQADYQNNCVQFSDNRDCDGVENGGKIYDECGVCGGDNSSCNAMSLYTRWGREDCPETARLVFKGFAAGSYHGHKGSGYNMLCLPQKPSQSVRWDHNDQNTNEGLVYGMEYETSGYGVGELTGVANYQVPCAVCETNASLTLMIPGTIECPDNPKFTLEYSGYLMSDHYTSGYYKGEYICVDRQAKARSGSPANSNHGRLFPTETDCGALPCGPYTQNREVSCAVCATRTVDVAAVFTNWGRNSCPDSSEQLYKGYAAASHYTHHGSGANMVCLTAQPRYHQYNDGNHNGALLYGVTYALSLPSYSHMNGHRVPCSVCLAHTSNTLIIPGRSDCPLDWIAWYSGYLVAAHYSYNSKLNWECLNGVSESGGWSSSSHTFLYNTEIECGSINCRNQEDRYVQDRELTCALCSPPAGHRGVVFSRWGRSMCPSGSKLLYSGFAAGSSHSHSGSGANVLCMRSVPTYGEFNSGNNNGALLYGYEYRSGGLRSTDFTSLSSHEVPCAVCEAEYAVTSYTVFGSNKCPTEYLAAYTGYTFSHHYSHTSKGQYVCVDEQPEAYDNTLGGTSHGQAILYPVDMVCGSLPCPPYHSNREIMCAQCIKRARND